MDALFVIYQHNTQEQEKSLNDCKRMICCDKCLAHFDPSVKLELVGEASKVNTVT